MEPVKKSPSSNVQRWQTLWLCLLLAAATFAVFGQTLRHKFIDCDDDLYLVMLFPVVGLIQAGRQSHADRYTYLPQIGVYVAVAWLVAEWRVSRVALGGLMTGVLAVLMVCASKQTEYWQDSETLWPHTLACTTDNDMAHNNLGVALLEHGKVDEAISQYQMALQINSHNADTHDNLGLAFLQKGGVDEAIAQYQQGLEIDPKNARAHNNLGLALLQKGRVDEAIAQYQQALEMTPDDESVHYNLAKAFVQKGGAEEAIAQFQAALKIAPADMETQSNLAWLLATVPQASLRNGEKAVQLARQANELAGGKNPVILGTLAAAFAECGRFDGAVQNAQKAITLAQAAGQQDLAGKLNSELQRYKAGLPLHQ